MTVARRQRREKPVKIEQRKVRKHEGGPQVKQTALLASPIYIGQDQGGEKKRIKRGAKTEPGASFLCLLGRPTLTPQGCTILFFPNKTAVTSIHLLLQIFPAVRQN